MKVLHNYVTIELIEEPSKIIQVNKPASAKGKIVGIGSKVKADIKIGDVIYYGARSSHEYQNLSFVEENEILAVENGN